MIVIYLYLNAFRLQRMGMATAMGYIVFMTILFRNLYQFPTAKALGVL